jgi:ankyrin repeat protein
MADQELIVGTRHTQSVMEHPITDELPDLMQIEDVNFNELALREFSRCSNSLGLQQDMDWSDLVMDTDYPILAESHTGRSPVFVQHYSKLLSPLSWFEFMDWIVPELEHLFRSKSLLPSDIPTDMKSTRNGELSMIMKNMMGLSKMLPGEMQKAVRFFSNIIPERFEGEMANKVSGFDNPIHTQIQTAEVLLSIFANNHRSILSKMDQSQFQEWMMEIPIALVEMVSQRKDPTAVATFDGMLAYSLDSDCSDVVHRLLKAKKDKAYFSGVQGGKLLLKLMTLFKEKDKGLLLEILACSPSLAERTAYLDTALHLAAKHFGPDIVKDLIKRGADLKAQNKDDATPFGEAINWDNYDNMLCFLENGVSIEELERILDSTDYLLPLKTCEIIWEKHLKTSPRITAYLLIYSAISGIDKFAAKVAEISPYYNDVTSILEATLCIAMKILQDFENESFLYDYFTECEHETEDEDIGDISWIKSDIIDTLLEYGVDPNATSVTKYPCPLILAIRDWTVEEVNTLLDFGAKLNQKQVMRALFHGPVTPDRYDIIRHILIDRKAEIYTQSLPKGRYLLQAICAMHRGSEGFELVKYLVRNGAKVNGRVSADDNYTALHFAIQHGQLETARYLIENGARVRGWLKTPVLSLYELCVERCSSDCDWGLNKDKQEELLDRIAIWELLLEVHAEANEESDIMKLNFGRSLAQAIIEWPRSPLVDIVMKSHVANSSVMSITGHWGGKWQKQGPFSPLQLAIKSCDIKTVKDLVSNGANINEAAGRTHGGTALQLAVLKANYQTPFDLGLVLYLLEHGADVNAIGAKESGRTALQQACELKPLNYKLIQLLIDHKADVNGPPAEDSGRTALQVACVREEIDFKLINLLIERGANINAPAASIKGITALQGAVINGNIELVVQLLEKGAQVDAAGAQVEGRTAIEAAAQCGRLTIAQILLNAHRTVRAVPKLKTAITLARDEGHLGIVKLFEDYQKDNPSDFSG